MLSVKNLDLAWRVWDEWQAWWTRKKDNMHKWVEENGGRADTTKILVHEGRTEREIYDMYRWMVNLLARLVSREEGVCGFSI